MRSFTRFGYYTKKDMFLHFFGRKVRETREAMGISRKALGESLGISPANVAQIELARNASSFFNSTLICRELGLHPIELLNQFENEKLQHHLQDSK